MELTGRTMQRFDLLDVAIAECRQDLKDGNEGRGIRRAIALHSRVDRLVEEIEAEVDELSLLPSRPHRGGPKG